MSHRNTIDIYFACLLAYLIPLALLSGPFLPDLFLVIISIIFLYRSIKHKEYKYFNSKFTLLFLLFYSVICLSTLLSDNIIFSFKSSLFYIRFGIFALTIWFLIDRIKNFTIILSITICFSVIDSSYQYFFDKTIFFDIGTENYSRFSLPFTDKWILGGYLSRIFPLFIGLLILQYQNTAYMKYVISIIILLVALVIFLSGERTAIGLILIILFLITVFLRDFFIQKIFILPTVIISFGILSILNISLLKRNILLTIEQLGLNNGSFYLLSPLHESFFITSINIFKNYLFLGSGPNTFRKLCSDVLYAHNEISCSTHPHNTYFQILAETGMIGFIFLTLIFLIISKKLLNTLFQIKLIKSNIINYKICLLICFIVSLWPFFPTQNFFNNWINIIYYLPIGFYLKLMYKEKKNSVQIYDSNNL